MFKNISEMINFLLVEEEIANLDIRTMYKGSLYTITFCIDYVRDNYDKIFSKPYNEYGIQFKNIDYTSAFMEVFLAHKTMVVFSGDLGSDSQVKDNKHSFSIIDDEKFELFASPDSLSYRNFLGEVVSALIDINEKPICFYADSNNTYSIILEKSTKYSKEKVKYAISMVAKAYNININKFAGVFEK